MTSVLAEPDRAEPAATPPAEGASHRTRSSWIAVAIPAFVLLVASWQYRWVQEDAFINFRIIDNLVAGHGPVYNVGERVEAYSDPLWLYLMAVVHLVIRPLSLEWMSVVLGIGLTVAGAVVGGRAVQQLAAPRQPGTAIPVGLYLFAVVAGVWEFASGGLEMGLVFAWIAYSFWLLVRVQEIRRGNIYAGLILGLGTLIRPELALMSGVFLFVLLVMAAAPGWRGPSSWTWRFVLPLVAAAFLPAVYELFRMAYFAMIVSNTALAKSAGSTWWNQGFTYLWNFVAPYTLWLPFAFVAPLVARGAFRWWRTGDRIGVMVLATPLAAGLVDLVYVVAIGGDYQHARLLLPAFFAVCVGLVVSVDDLRTAAMVPAVGIAIWCVVCLGWLRYDPSHETYHLVHGISNERDAWIGGANGAHPVALGSYGEFTLPGDEYRDLAASAVRDGHKVLVIATDPFAPLKDQVISGAATALPEHTVVNLIEIGSRGLVSGPDVYVFDTQSLANPIGAHTIVARGDRPGGKPVALAWMVGRFGAPGDKIPAVDASPQWVAAARTALSCGTLGAYMHAITTPLTWFGAFSNLTHAVGYTTLKFSFDPVIAEHQLCRTKAAT